MGKPGSELAWWNVQPWRYLPLWKYPTLCLCRLPLRMLEARTHYMPLLVVTEIVSLSWWRNDRLHASISCRN